MALQIITGCAWPVGRVVENDLPGYIPDPSRWPCIGKTAGGAEVRAHPTAEAHSVLWAWACELGPERNDERFGACVIDHHHACRACVLAMGVAASNRPWRDLPLVGYMRVWYEQHRHAHELPPIPKGR